MVGQSQPGNNMEVAKRSQGEQKESNLLPTAQLVNGMMKQYIMPVLRDSGMVQRANELMKSKLPSDDPKVIEFAIECRAKQAEITAKAEEAKCDEKQLAVISNYFSKLIASIKAAEAPKAAV